MKEPGAELRFYNLPGCWVALAAIGATSVAGGVWLIVTFASEGAPFWVGGCAMVLTGLPAVLLGLRVLVWRIPYLIIDVDGVHLRQRTTEFFPWSQIKAADIIVQSGQLFLMLRLVNPERLTESNALMDFKALLANLHFKEVALTDDTLPIPLFGRTVNREAVVEVLRNHGLATHP